MSIKRQLWLHVGLPKTATTAFQSWMRHNADALAKQGIDYPDIFGAGNDKHNFLVGALRQNRQLEQLETLLKTTTGRILVLSDEGLSNHLDDFGGSALARFRELTKSWDVSVALVTREAEAWTRSYHKQCVLNPNNGASPLWGTSMTVSDISNHPRILRLLKTQMLATDLAEAFGAVEVKEFAFEAPTWFEDCLGQIGYQQAGRVTLPKTNQSLQDWSIELLRRVNELTDDQAIRNGWKLAMQAYLETNHTILTNLLSDSDGAHVDHTTYEALSKTYQGSSEQGVDEASAFLLSLGSQ